MAPPVQRPPQEWIKEQDQLFGIDEIHALKLWCSMSFKQRHNIRRRLATLEKVRKKVSAGSKDNRLLRAVQTGIYRRPQASLSLVQRTKLWEEERRERLSRELLSFQSLHKTGCVIDGCPLNAVDDAYRPLLEHDHIDQASKISDIARLHGSRRDDELPKTRCLCLWHHWVRTREQRAVKPTPDLRCKKMRKLALEKERRGCQHPLQSGMVYASLIPLSTMDPRMYGFLQVSHVRLDSSQKAAGKRATVVSKLQDVESGAAVIHCYFCHKLYTVLENGMLFPDSSVSARYADALRLRHPDFSRHFDNATSGMDWGAHSALIRSRKVAGHAKRNNRRQFDPSPTLFEYGYGKNPKRFRIFWEKPARSLKSAVAQITSAFFTIVDDDSA